MIRKGFILIENGQWHSLKEIKYFYLEYSLNHWNVLASRKSTFPICVQSHFETIESAQEWIDKIMCGEV